MFLRFKFFIFFAFLMLLGGASAIYAQQPAATPPVTAATATATVKTPEAAGDKSSGKKDRKQKAADLAAALKNPTAEQVAETTVAVYGGLGGRATLNQIRKTSVERGRISVLAADGKTTEQANYERWILRSADSLDKERIRFEQEFPNARYALVYSGAKIFGLYNDAVFAPNADASKAFENQIWHGLEALLRYKESGSTVALDGRDKVFGVDIFRLDVTDKQNRKTRFYISAKSFRVMWLEYTENATKYTRRFYDYNYAQGTLVPFRSVLFAGDKQIEEVDVNTISFGQKVEEGIFNES